MTRQTFFYLVMFVLFAFVLAVLSSPTLKGKRGERIVAARLGKGLPGNYVVINDIYLPLPDGSTTQIDHVVVSSFGIFVVETKNYGGWIFGDGKSANWTQVIFQKRSKFQNPVMQNSLHVRVLSHTLGIPAEYFTGVVIFADESEFKTKMPEGVVHTRDATNYILSFKTPRIDKNQVCEIAASISSWNHSVSEERKNAHVQNLKRRHQN